MEQNTFTWRRIVEHIIDFLSDSPSDLTACALVSRAFVYAAQSYIFKEISVSSSSTHSPGTDHLWSGVRETLHRSPHLIRHIHRLRPHPRRVSFETLSAICKFPFTHLNGVLCSGIRLSPASAIALQQLFTLPSLRSVEIACRVDQPSTFLQIWDRCSSSIKHLDLTCYHRPIAALKGVHHWMNHTLCPFNLSDMTSLSLVSYTEVFFLAEVCGHSTKD
ncbi:hypothetical protein FB451DRAFT_365902 [Mycena latifolia]|nr:hypothetical protein FB451DRAFT_365902 [Mycena latifolia]